MIFTRLAFVAAWLALCFGAVQLLIGIGIATKYLGPYEFALRRYGDGSPSSGAMIDKGMYKVLVAAALGTLAEISLRAKKRDGVAVDH